MLHASASVATNEEKKSATQAPRGELRANSGPNSDDANAQAGMGTTAIMPSSMRGHSGPRPDKA
ncbi:MAG: hypothetical protein ACTHMP_20045 [Thermomicrobiales bacterium]